MFQLAVWERANKHFPRMPRKLVLSYAGLILIPFCVTQKGIKFEVFNRF